jgi:hypothetical protein
MNIAIDVMVFLILMMGFVVLSVMLILLVRDMLKQEKK